MQYKGVATYRLKHKCVHIWNKNMGRFYHSSDGCLMLCVQDMRIEPVLISLNPILIKFVMVLVSLPQRHPFDDLSQINAKLPNRTMALRIRFQVEFHL